MQKQLQQLVDLLPGVKVIGNVRKTIKDISSDSRVVQEGPFMPGVGVDQLSGGKLQNP